MAQRSPGTPKFASAPLRISIVALVMVISLQGGVVGGLSGSDPQTGRAPVELSDPDSQAKNVILLIGDGMGPVQIEAARWEKAGRDPAVYPSTTLAMDRLAYSGTVATRSANSAVTDSAAAVTALMTGTRTNNGMIGHDSDGARLESIAELVDAAGRSTGAVTTTSITHATPAGVYAHVNDRDNELLIARQFIGSDLEVALGGGYRYFIGTGTMDPWGAKGYRTDGRDLVDEAKAQGYTVVTTASTLGAVPAASGTKVLGLFAPNSLKYESDRAGSQQPALAEMTGTALSVLAMDADGFFLMVEGGRIDTAAHAQDYAHMTGEVLAFDEAVRTAIDFADAHPDTLLIVTADHETGGLVLRENGDGAPTPVFTTTGHTATDVPIMASGPGADQFGDRRIDNTRVFEVLRDVMNLYPVAPTPTYDVVNVPPVTTAPIAPVAVPTLRSSVDSGKRYAVGNPGSFIGTRFSTGGTPTGTSGPRVVTTTDTVQKPGSRAYGVTPPKGQFVRWYPAARWESGIN